MNQIETSRRIGNDIDPHSERAEAIFGFCNEVLVNISFFLPSQKAEYVMELISKRDQIRLYLISVSAVIRDQKIMALVREAPDSKWRELMLLNKCSPSQFRNKVLRQIELCSEKCQLLLWGD